MQPSSDIRRLIDIMAALRDPVAGCPWDVEQTFASIAPFTIEEAYEVADAIERGATEDLREELGDLLLQVVFHARMAEEAGLFDFGGVVEAITAKLVRRHPHVFGRRRRLSSRGGEGAVGTHQGGGEAGKAPNRARKRGLPPEPRRARSPAFRWLCRRFLERSNCRRRPARSVSTGTMCARCWRRSGEEIAEVEAEIATGSAQALSGEVGDLIFAVVNLARHLKVDPESALARRQRQIRAPLRAYRDTAWPERGQTPEGASLDEMESLWVEAKARELGRADRRFRNLRARERAWPAAQRRNVTRRRSGFTRAGDRAADGKASLDPLDLVGRNAHSQMQTVPLRRGGS